MTEDIQQTLVLIKPDGVQRGLVGEIISRLEARGLRIAAMKMQQLDVETASRHYGVHRERPFFKGLVDFITSSPLVALVLEGPNAVELVRRTIGATNPLDAQPGTIRGDLAVEIGRNLIHGSDSTETAPRKFGYSSQKTRLRTTKEASNPGLPNPDHRGQIRIHLSTCDKEEAMQAKSGSHLFSVSPSYQLLEM